MRLIAAVALSSILAGSLAAQQYKVEPISTPAPDEVAALRPALAAAGVRVLKPTGDPLCEMWFAAAEPRGGAAEQNTTWSSVPHGALLGVVRVPARWADRRGQSIRPGVYTMRYSFYPMNGDHQGVAPQRDFAILSPAASDSDPAARPGFDALMELSRKASGTPHPLVLSLWKDDSPAAPGIEAQGENDQVLHVRIGATAVSIIVIGKAEG